MSTIAWAFFAGAAVGAYVSALWLLHLMERRAQRYKEATTHLTVTPEVLNQLNGIMVSQWLDQRGMCWMPKGQEFKWPKEKEIKR